MADITLTHHGDGKVIILVRATAIDTSKELLKLSIAESMQLSAMLSRYASQLHHETVRVELPEKTFELRGKGCT